MSVGLWDEIEVGGLRISNRAVMPAMGTGYASREGKVTERLLAYLGKRASGGVGLIITEVCAVHPAGKGLESELGAYDDSFIPGLEELAATVKDGGPKVALQLHHAGRETFPQIIGGQPVAPSPIPSRAMRQKPRALSCEEIADLVDCYASAARRARQAGFDAVEVHGAHGYLVNQFLSPYSNRRDDIYGKDARGRLRFAREIVREIKKEAGSDFPVIFRLSSSEEVKGGYTLDYILPLLPLLEDEGVDAFHVSCGVMDSPGNPTCPGMHHPPGINVERAASIKGEVGVPVIVVGKIHDPRQAEEVLKEGKADMVAFGRQHLADPLFLSKAREGRYEDIRFCLSCNQGCIERLAFEFKPATCVINPECGEEWRRYESSGASGPFLVAGAGPAGLQAAITLREAGAEVNILERDKAPGGQLRAASRPDGKQPYADWVNWALRRLDALGTRIKLGVEADAEELSRVDWAGVVAANGAEPIWPQVPGAELELNVEARAVLLGQVDTGERVLIVGAGQVGMEVSDYLLQRKRLVTVVEQSEYPPVSPFTSHGYYLHRELRVKGELLLATTVLEVKEWGAKVSVRGEKSEIQADSIVWAIGSLPEVKFALAARKAGMPVEKVGDAVEPRRLLEAVHEGARAAGRLLYGS
jgi:2,4-dienoyl-CoA reductase-like NADH-dependent reductase (Old Yellow Enzyme family)/thioredoxin reductase